MIPENMLSKGKSLNERLFEEAVRLIPGGVNSPVRAFIGIGEPPVFADSGKGSVFTCAEGKKYIDFCMSWGAHIFGHADEDIINAIKETAEKSTSFGMPTENETVLAAEIKTVMPSIEKLRLVNSGTEAVMSALRLARGYTGRDNIVKFEGAYHGHSDSLLVKGGSGLAHNSISSSAGVPYDFIKHTIILPYNNIAALEKVLSEKGDSIAAVIIEPVQANHGLMIPDREFLAALRKLTEKYGIVLIFDEVITGFRIALGGAQSFFNITPDLSCLGKIIGGGLPIGAFGGKKEIMDQLAPEGDVYQAGTLSGNPLSVSAGLAALRKLKITDPYEELEKNTEQFVTGISITAEQSGIDLKIEHIASIFSIGSNLSGTEFADLYKSLLKEGVYLSPSQLEVNFISAAHKKADLESTADIFEKVFKDRRKSHDI